VSTSSPSSTVAVITTTNFRLRDAHELSDRLVVEHVLPLVDG